MLYMYLGEWEKASAAILKCISANAYYPDNGSDEKESMNTFKIVSEKIIIFLLNNPGFLQRNIYKSIPFSEDERHLAQIFCRNSRLIMKEQVGKSYMLFVNAPSNV